MRVLLGVGGSDDSIRAFERTVARTRAVGDELTVAVVDNPASNRSVDEVEEMVRDTLRNEEFDADVRVVEGDPGSRLVAIAEDEDFDVIVLGGGETSPMGKINVGSIAEFVLLNSHVSVTLIR
jgi:nucleotide-binding universal stress UspA family protein